MFGRPGRRLERDLRRARPEPEQSLITELSRRMDSAPGHSRASRPRRLLLATAAVAVAVVGAGATGGLGHAQTALSSLSGSIASSLEQAVSPGPVAQSESGVSAGIQSTITQYQGAGWYCTRALSEPDPDKGFLEQFISSQAQFTTVSASYEMHRFDGATTQPCNKNNH